MKRRKHLWSNLSEDLALVRAGVMDWASFYDLRRAVTNPVSIEVRRADGSLKAQRYTHNLRTNAGGDWQAMTMAGFTGQLSTTASVYNGQSRVATSALSATTLTDTSASPAFNANTSANIAGRIVVVSDGAATNIAFGICNSATATVLTVDKWHVIGSATDATTALGGTGGAPAGAALAYAILPPQAPAWYIGLSADAVAPSAADTTLASETNSNGISRSFADILWIHTSPSGATQQNTVYTIAHKWTASGTVSSLQKCGMFNASANGTLCFENTFGATTLNINDTMQINWQVTA